MKAIRLAWVGIRTDDYDATVRLFRDVLGLEVELEEEQTTELSLPAGERVQVFGRGHRYHEIFGTEARGPVPLFEVADVRGAERRLAEAGLEIVGSLESDSDWDWLNFRGPDGNLYAVASRRG
jgi:catechol 2,3-dioxygenase-like lactoylglutathione lyase family enzyme